MINQILHIGRRGGKTFQQAIDIVTYINDNKLTECNINVLEVPNDYKSAWEELMNLYRVTFKDTMSKNDYMVLHTLEELEKKYNLGTNKE